MIVSIVSGVFVSVAAIWFFLSLRFNTSVERWILATSKFIYYLGHPLLNDDQKQEKLTGHFKYVFGSLALVIAKTLLFLAFIILMLALVSFLVWFVNEAALPDFAKQSLSSLFFPEWLYQWPFIAGTFLPLIVVPFVFKNKKQQSPAYSPLDKLLHYVFLGNSNLARLLFRLEVKRNRKLIDTNQVLTSVYVSGLARAGTTVLMQYLGQIGEFRSLSYRHMPFIFMPRTGLKLSSKSKTKARERAHQDGVMHSLDSFEALEEPFWRNYSGGQYIMDDKLVNYEVTQLLHSKYTQFRKLIAGNHIYLAKNNNHLLRASSLHTLDAGAGNKTITLIPFREPNAQATSLLTQHQLLTDLALSDEFVKDYMDFLVHHEFGVSQKVPVINHAISPGDLPANKFEVAYWLEVWYHFYSQVLELFKSENDFYFFCYESFVDDPQRSLEILVKQIGLDRQVLNSVSIRKYTPRNIHPPEASTRYLELYKQMKSISIN